MITTLTPTSSSSTTFYPALKADASQEEEILRQLKLGQAKAIDYLFDQYYNLMCNKALSYVKNTNRAEDIVQDVFLNIWRKRSEINIHSTFKGYLLKCVTHRALNYIRDSKSHCAELDDQIMDNSLGIEDEMYYNDTEQIIMHYIDTLSPRCRQIFIMNRIDQMKYKEISNELGISIKTVEHHIAKALHFMRERLSDLKQLSYS
jgi:RNA polymerase sigma-70 factor (ECF subfamily)